MSVYIHGLKIKIVCSIFILSSQMTEEQIQFWNPTEQLWFAAIAFWHGFNFASMDWELIVFFEELLDWPLLLSHRVQDKSRKWAIYSVYLLHL